MLHLSPTNHGVDHFVNDALQTIEELKQTLRSKDILKSIVQMQEEQTKLQKQIDGLMLEKAKEIKKQLIGKIEQLDDKKIISQIIDLTSAEAVKSLAFELKNQYNDLVLVLGHVSNEKPQITIAISDDLVTQLGLHAGQLVKELAKEIKGGGGGQPFYATAGGTEMSGLTQVIQKSKLIIQHSK